MRIGLPLRAAVALLLAAAAIDNAWGAKWVLVSQGKGKKVSVLSLDETSGGLEALTETPLPGAAGAMAVHPSGDRLYVAERSRGKILTLAIEENGALTPLGAAEAGGAASYLCVHPSGDWLLSAYYREGKVAVHRIGDDGVPGSAPSQTVMTDKNAHAVVLDPTGRYAFVPHTGPNVVYQFVFDQATGRLTPNDPAVLRREPGAEPRHLWFHPRLPRVYGSDEHGATAAVYRFDERAGTLSLQQAVPSLPAGARPKQNKTSDIEVHPSGGFVYLANRGHNSIAVYRVDERAGTLTPVQHAPTEPIPRSFNLSPDGRFLVAAGQRSGRLAVYRVGVDGLLERVGGRGVGGRPAWVLILDRPAANNRTHPTATPPSIGNTKNESP